VETGALLMTQKDRDRLVVLRKAQKKLITQRQAAEELGVTSGKLFRSIRKNDTVWG
jgi:hypothetical protein